MNKRINGVDIRRLKALYHTLEHWRNRWSKVADLGVDTYSAKNVRVECKVLARLEAAQRAYESDPANDAMFLLKMLEAAEQERDDLRRVLQSISDEFSNDTSNQNKIANIYHLVRQIIPSRLNNDLSVQPPQEENKS